MTDGASGISSNRGWNDPPKLHFSTEGHTPPKKQLTQRVTHILPTENRPPTGDLKKTAEILPLSAKRPNQPNNLPPPPTNGTPAGPEQSPVTEDLTTPPGGNLPETVNTSSSGELPSCEDVLSRLMGTTDECKEKLKTRVSDDIKRKLGILEQAWHGDKLPMSVQLDMDKLSEALTERRYDEANQIHLNLMMNHISVVSGWMVGIKRLISEAKTILPPEIDASTTDQGEPCQEVTTPILIPVNTGSS